MLGCAGLADLVEPAVTAPSGVPVVEGVAAAVGIAGRPARRGSEHLARQHLRRVPDCPPSPERGPDEHPVPLASSSTTPTPRRGMTGPTDVLVDGDRIAAIGADAGSAPPGTGSSTAVADHLLLPGLINAHFHSPANHLKGSVRSLPLELFMLFESPADPALTPTPREAYLRTMLGAIEMLQRGITSVQDDAFLMPLPDSRHHRRGGSRPTATAGSAPPSRWTSPSCPRPRSCRSCDELADPQLRRGAATHRRRRDAAHLARGLRPPDRHLARRGARTGSARPCRSRPRNGSAPTTSPRSTTSPTSHGLPLYAHMLETKAQRALTTEQPRFAGRSLVRYTADLGLLQPAHQRHPRRLGRRRRPRPDRRRRVDGGAQPGQQPAAGQRRDAAAVRADPRHPRGPGHRRGHLRRHGQRVDRGQDGRSDPQRHRARPRRSGRARRRCSHALWVGGARAQAASG